MCQQRDWTRKGFPGVLNPTGTGISAGSDTNQIRACPESSGMFVGYMRERAHKFRNSKIESMAKNFKEMCGKKHYVTSCLLLFLSSAVLV